MVVEVRNLSKQYQWGNKILADVAFAMKRGEFCYLVGGSGAGKTTFLRMLSTEDRPTTGTVKLFGFDWVSSGASRLQTVRRSIGYIPQAGTLVEDLSLFDNVLLGLESTAKKITRVQARQLVDQVLGRLDLFQRRDAFPAECSGGELQRVKIARALVRSPDLVIADEPTGAQDPEHAWQIMELFAAMNRQGATVVVATHDHQIVQKFRKRAVHIERGRLLGEGI